MPTSQQALQVLSQLGQTSLQSELTEQQRKRDLSKEKVEYAEAESGKMRAASERAAAKAKKKGKLFGNLATLAGFVIPGGTAWARPLVQGLLAGAEAKETKDIYSKLSKKEFGKDTFFGGYGRAWQDETKAMAESIDPGKMAFTKGLTAFAMDKMKGKVKDIGAGQVENIKIGDETIFDIGDAKKVGDLDIDLDKGAFKDLGLKPEMSIDELLKVEGAEKFVGDKMVTQSFGEMQIGDRFKSLFGGAEGDWQETLTNLMTRFEPSISGTAAGIPEMGPTSSVPSQAELYRLFSEQYG